MIRGIVKMAGYTLLPPAVFAINTGATVVKGLKTGARPQKPRINEGSA
jgi:hypothetical protein